VGVSVVGEKYDASGVLGLAREVSSDGGT